MLFCIVICRLNFEVTTKSLYAGFSLMVLVNVEPHTSRTDDLPAANPPGSDGPEISAGRN